MTSLALLTDDVEEEPQGPPRDFNAESAAGQAGLAAIEMDREAKDFLHLPWPSLDAIVGGIPPATLWYLALFSGFGKTTWLATFAELALARGERVYVMPLESRPHTFRTHLAARKLGYHPGDLLSGAYLHWPDPLTVKARMINELDRMRQADTEWRGLKVSAAQAFDADTVETALLEAADFRADWVLIDHVDHLATHDRESEYQVSYRGNKRLADLTKATGARVIASSQLNFTLTRGNPLALHTIPSEDMIKFGAHKREVSDGMLAGCRPLKVAGIDPAVLKAYRARLVGVHEVVEPGCMLLGVTKHRLYGEHVGKRVYLGVERGRVVDVNQDLYTSTKFV